MPTVLFVRHGRTAALVVDAVVQRAGGPRHVTAQAVSLHDDTETKSIPLAGEHVVLNRELLDSHNNSISRSGHASLTFRDGEWWLDNLSSLKSTFVQVNGPVRIQPGDAILLGDQLFRFKTD